MIVILLRNGFEGKTLQNLTQLKVPSFVFKLKQASAACSII